MTVFRPGPTLFIAVLLTSINALFSMLYLYSDEWLKRASGILEQHWPDRPDCLYSWANASLEYSEALTVISAQSLLFSGVIAAAVVISAVVFRDIAEKSPGKFGPVFSLLFGLAATSLWVCYIGAGEPALSIGELSSVSRMLFNSKFGIAFAAIFLNFAGHQLGEELARVFGKHWGKEALKYEHDRRSRGD